MPDPTGCFAVRMGEAEILVHPGLTLAELEGHAAARSVAWTYHPGATDARLARAEVLGRTCTFEARFDGQRLARLMLFIHLDSDGSSWDDWTLEQELARKRAHDELALELFGTPLTPRPIQLEAKTVAPLFPDGQWPRWAVFDWGSVVSSYDSKGGFSQLWIDLAPLEPERTPPRA